MNGVQTHRELEAACSTTKRYLQLCIQGKSFYCNMTEKR